jgi:hypothetical protein
VRKLLGFTTGFIFTVCMCFGIFTSDFCRFMCCCEHIEDRKSVREDDQATGVPSDAVTVSALAPSTDKPENGGTLLAVAKFVSAVSNEVVRANSPPATPERSPVLEQHQAEFQKPSRPVTRSMARRLNMNDDA